MTAQPVERMTRSNHPADAVSLQSALIGCMTGPVVFSSPRVSSISRRACVILAILASFVLLGAVGVVEVGALAAAAVVSSGTNHGGGGK
jgi:hypothetical protein